MRVIFLLMLLLLLAGCWMQAEVTEQEMAGTGHAVEVVNEVKEKNGVSAEVYFCPQDNCGGHFVELIESAEESVHCALFDLDLENVINAFRESEVDVKVVVDNNNAKGIENLEFVKFDNKNQLSHNKFCIVDGKVVWTGSFNPTVRGDTKNNNNVVVYESRFLAENYEAEFKELWRGEFSKGKRVNHPLVRLNGNLIENYFCPEDNCADRVIEVINSAEQSIYFMTFSFTHDLIGNALIRQHKKGVEVKGVFEKSQKNKWVEYDVLQDYGIDVKWDSNKANMHHKVFIIDEEIVVTGSFNPSKNGDERNDENVLIVHDSRVAGKFLEEFDKL